jgi:hypothetical protein
MKLTFFTFVLSTLLFLLLALSLIFVVTVIAAGEHLIVLLFLLGLLDGLAVPGKRASVDEILADAESIFQTKILLPLSRKFL